MSATSSQPFDLDALKVSLEAHDPAASAAIYAPDAVVETFNRDHGPGDPVVVRGLEALQAQAVEVASRNLTHRVDRAVAGDTSGASQVTCTYPDGLKVLCMSTFDHENGRITRETRMEVWDA